LAKTRKSTQEPNPQEEEEEIDRIRTSYLRELNLEIAGIG